MVEDTVGRDEVSVEDDAQLHTLEGLTASIILVLAVSFAFNSFVATPSPDLEPGTEADRQIASDLLAASEANGDLENAITHWNTTEHGFENATGSYYYEASHPDPEALEFGRNLQTLFGERGKSYNVELAFLRDGDTVTMTYVHQGEPGDSATRATQYVVVDEDTRLVDGEPVNATEYPIPREFQGFHNQVEVRLTVW